MATEKSETNKQDNNEDAPIKPEAETMNTTDPQEHMKGPLSSLMHNLEKTFDTTETKEEADKERDKI